MKTQQTETQKMRATGINGTQKTSASLEDSKNKKLSSPGLPPYSKRVIIAVSVAIPIAFGLNIPLNTFGTFMPVWGIIMINAIVIPSYMTFIIPKASKAFTSWLNSTTIRGVN